MALVVREDLSKRTALSKSELTTAYFCQTQAFFDRYHRRPWVPTPEMTFGSALDAAVEQIVTALRADIPVQIDRALAAATEAALKDEQPINLDEITNAAEMFVLSVAPQFDWAFAGTQHAINVDIPGWGPCNSHPDLILHDGTVLDVKSSGRAKSAHDIRYTPELGWYALLREAETGVMPPRVGYLTWVRTKRPWWQVLVIDVDPALTDYARQLVDRYVRARKANDVLNSRMETPENWTLTGGPRFPGKCTTCAYFDLCPIAIPVAEAPDAAAV